MIIAHISDLHLNYQGKTTHYNKVEELLRKIAQSEPDHLVISGDVSEDGRVEDFLFLRELLIKFDLLNPEKQLWLSETTISTVQPLISKMPSHIPTGVKIQILKNGY